MARHGTVLKIDHLASLFENAVAEYIEKRENQNPVTFDSIDLGVCFFIGDPMCPYMKVKSESGLTYALQLNNSVFAALRPSTIVRVIEKPEDTPND